MWYVDLTDRTHGTFDDFTSRHGGGCMSRLLVVLVFALSSYGIGQQHGIFRSQSTQGEAWTGQARIIEEKYRIGVYADYLDVELEWVFGVSGGKPAEHEDALEIVGNINLQSGAVVVGLLTWYKGMILEGKLKPLNVARQQYEEVVDRNAEVPPRPRDPVILEYLGRDNYDISIFPVEWGKTRRVRFRYLVPSSSQGKGNTIGYPRAFTSDAEVTVYRKAGLRSFTIKRSDGTIEHVDSDSVVLSPAEARGGIASLIPHAENEPEGSRLYVAPVETAGLSGEMAHFVGADMSTLLRSTALREEIVILWRWNHPEVLRKYARQIVEQANLLQAFLLTLESRNKQAALIIDIEGETRTVFQLDRKGGPEYKKMMARLYELSTMSYEKMPDNGTSPDYTDEEMEEIVARSHQEFGDALRLALTLFSNEEKTLRSVVLVTAGPRWVHGSTTDYSIEWDPRVSVTTLTQQLSREEWFEERYYPAEQLYWPGVNLNEFVSRYGGNMRIQGTVSNGVEHAQTESYAHTAPKQSYYWYNGLNKGPNELYIHSSKPFVDHVRWKLQRGTVELTEFLEENVRVFMPDADHFSRLVGASGELQSLDTELPRSMASTLGFVDEEYSLLALEEDALPDSQATQYELWGMPVLEPGDIFPGDSTEREMFTVSDNATDLRLGMNRNNNLPDGFVIDFRNRMLNLRLDPDRVDVSDRITVTLFSVSGRMLADLGSAEGRTADEVVFNLSHLALPGGMVLVRVQIGEAVYSRSIMVR